MMNNSISRFTVLTLLFCWCQGSLYAVTDDEVETRITEVFGAAQAAFASDPSGLEAQRILNRSRLVIDMIQPYFYGVPGALHEHSEARQTRVEKIEDWLSNYEPLFVGLIGTLSDPNTDSNAVADYVKFTKPTPRLKTALVDVARSESARPDNAAAAYDGIFYLQLDDPQIRREVVETMDWIDDRHSNAQLAANLRNMSATLWATPEMLDYWKKSLLVPFSPENFPERGGGDKLVVHYRWAASALSRFGEMDDGLAKLARQRAEEIRDAGGHERTVEKLIFAAEILEGKRPPEIAVNWKGQLLGASQSAVNQQAPEIEASDDAKIDRVVKKDTADQEVKPSSLASSGSGRANYSNWLIFAGGIAVVGILIILLRASRGKA